MGTYLEPSLGENMAHPSSKKIDHDLKEHFFELLGNVQPLFFFTRGAEGRITFISPSVTSVLGYSVEDLMENWSRYLTGHPKNEQARKHFNSGPDESCPQSPFHLEIYHKDSHAVWLKIIESPVKDQSGKVVEAAGLAMDITESKRMEEGLRSSEERFREISESSPVGIFQIDANDLYTYVNTRWQHITGYPLITTLGHHWWDILHKEDHEEIFKTWAECERNKTEFFLECRITRPDEGIRWVQIRTRFFFSDLGQNVLGTLVDITERKNAEEKIRQFSRQLERSNQDLKDFASIASHDLQEPLRKITSFGNLLKSKYYDQLGEEENDYVERMLKASTRMQRLIHDLLEYSKVTTKPPHFESTDLAKIVSEVLSDLEVRIDQKKARVTVEALPVIEADPMQMRQLFQNLIGNALKFHKEGESPVIKVSSKLASQNDHWEICVADQGIGFDEKNLQRLFKPFERLHGRSQFEGSGMGTAICYKIVEHHGGKISAKSVPQKGTSFFVTLPARPSKCHTLHP